MATLHKGDNNAIVIIMIIIIINTIFFGTFAETSEPQ